MVVEAFLANGSRVNAGLVSRLDEDGLSLTEVDVTNQDTVLSVYTRVMNAQTVPLSTTSNLTYLNQRVRSGPLVRALRRLT